MAEPAAEAWQLRIDATAVPASATVSEEVIHFPPDAPLPGQTEGILRLDAGLNRPSLPWRRRGCAENAQLRRTCLGEEIEG